MPKRRLMRHSALHEIQNIATPPREMQRLEEIKKELDDIKAGNFPPTPTPDA